MEEKIHVEHIISEQTQLRRKSFEPCSGSPASVTIHEYLITEAFQASNCLPLNISSESFSKFLDSRKSFFHTKLPAWPEISWNKLKIYFSFEFHRKAFS